MLVAERKNRKGKEKEKKIRIPMITAAVHFYFSSMHIGYIGVFPKRAAGW